MKKYFINPESGLFRAGWRIILFIIVFIAISFVVMSGVRAVLGGLKGGGLLQFTLLSITATIAVYIARKYFDKKSLISLGVKWDKYAALDILSGFLNSALVMAGIFFVMLWADLIEFRGFSWWMDSTGAAAAFSVAAIPVILVVLFKMSIVSWWEELVFRGYILQNIISGTSLLWAIIITSVLFGAIHAGNPGATTLSTFLLVITTPQLIYAYVKTGQLWLPMGIHLGWNFFQSSVFGYAASGMDSPTMISQVPVAADWLSGGEFGAEGSILVIPFTILSLFLIHFWVRATRKPGQGVFETLV
jgi:membrane protease YdiL (CAAX protease family)